MEYKDLDGEAKKQYEDQVKDALKPFEERKIIRKLSSSDKPLWGTSVNLKKLMIAVRKGLANKGKNPDYVVINGSSVLLSIFLFIISKNEVNEEENRLLDEYIDDLRKI